MTGKLFLAMMTSALIATGAQAQEWQSSAGGGLFVSQRSSTDTDIDGNPFVGTYLTGEIARDFGALRLSIDGRLEFMSDGGEDDVYVTGPLHAGVLGLHLGRDFGKFYGGAFLGAGLFDGYDSDSPMSGTIGGLEFAVAVNEMISVTGQLGYLNAIGDPTDNEFEGMIARVGVDAQVSDRTLLSFSAENGFSKDCFVDCGDQPGEYFGLTVGAEYALNDRVTLVGSLTSLRIEDYDDPDTGTDTSVFVGARIAFGAAAPSGPRLHTPIMPLRAAGWMEPLD
ncbi:hypothetical protein [Phaeovulum sp.]|uniref:hypothetical protein n=1 Tax=Phaeovulum sp. TaxID=2934796 RepID=UPI00356993CD